MKTKRKSFRRFNTSWANQIKSLDKWTIQSETSNIFEVNSMPKIRHLKRWWFLEKWIDRLNQSLRNTTSNSDRSTMNRANRWKIVSLVTENFISKINAILLLLRSHQGECGRCLANDLKQRCIDSVSPVEWISVNRWRLFSKTDASLLRSTNAMSRWNEINWHCQSGSVDWSIWSTFVSQIDWWISRCSMFSSPHLTVSENASCTCLVRCFCMLSVGLSNLFLLTKINRWENLSLSEVRSSIWKRSDVFFLFSPRVNQVPFCQPVIVEDRGVNFVIKSALQRCLQPKTEWLISKISTNREHKPEQDD